MNHRNTGGLLILLMCIGAGAEFGPLFEAQAQPAGLITATIPDRIEPVQAAPAELAKDTPPPTAGFEYDVDRPGSDIRNFEFEDADVDVEQNAAACAAACQNDQQCRAWTYVRPGVQGPKSRCWLKDAVPAPVGGASFAISGVVRPEGETVPPVAGTTPGQPVGGAGAVGCQGFTGSWSDNLFGKMVLKQDGNRVTGSFEGTVVPGTIEGTVTGQALDANWVGSDGRSGTAHLELSGDGSTYKGELAMTGWGGRVNGKCEGPAPQG